MQDAAIADLAQRPVTLAAEQWGALGSRLTALESSIQVHSSCPKGVVQSRLPFRAVLEEAVGWVTAKNPLRRRLACVNVRSLGSPSQVYSSCVKSWLTWLRE